MAHDLVNLGIAFCAGGLVVIILIVALYGDGPGPGDGPDAFV